MATDFEERSRTWDDDPGKVERGRIVAQAVRAAVPLTRRTRVLEYGAGTGLASQALAGYVGPLTLADPSEGMRSVMTEKVASGALPAGTRVWDLDLTSASVPEERFDLILTVMALHHITDLDPVLGGFATLLDTEGTLCVVDLEEDVAGSFHSSDQHFEGHHGFERERFAGKLEAAGFAEVRFTHCLDVYKDGVAHPLFLATATPRPT